MQRRVVEEKDRKTENVKIDRERVQPTDFIFNDLL